MERPMQAFFQGLQNMLQQERLVDFVIACGPYEFKVHKAVICAQSDYFSAACSNSKFEEGKSGKITLKAVGAEDGDDEACDDPETVKLMVHYLYYFDYEVPSLDIVAPPGRSLFSTLPNNQQQNTNLFSGSSNAGGGFFRHPGQQQQNNTASMLFSNQSKTATSSLFGGANNSTAGGGLFGNNNNNNNQQQQQQNARTNLFANLGDNAGRGLFGAPDMPAAGGLFGNNTGYNQWRTQQELAAESDGNMIMHAKVHAVAVKYQVPALQDLAARKFIAAVAANWNHDSFADAAYIVYTTTPEEIRALRTEVVNTLLQHGSLLDKPAVEGLVCGIIGLAFELLKGSRQVNNS
ncbi:hypothetical protein LTR17_015072 [Elasticomyces elasticus]|nr:hypothetical protein LTR17_015072 [Elasticomyces elasticus]